MPYLNEGFSTCNLEKINQPSLLQSRTDFKFTCPALILKELVELLKKDYELLDINGNRIFTYLTTYYDTDQLYTYHEHHRQKANRFKVRFRNYVESNTAMLEIKWKNCKGKTSKSRLSVSQVPEFLDTHQGFFLENNILNYQEFKPQLNLRYQRISFIHKLNAEKITLDFNLEASNSTDTKQFPELLIVEVKAPGKMEASSLQFLRKLEQREGGLSKYCLGTIALRPSIKHNLFKPLYSKILNLKNIYANS